MRSNKLVVAGQSEGWISSEIFDEYCDYLIEWIKNYRVSLSFKPYEPFLLFSDSHSSRKDSELLEKLKLNNITMVTFPSHTTHILQPLDVSVYGVFKKHFRDQVRKLGSVEFDFGELIPSKATVTRAKQIVGAIEALHLSTSLLQVSKSFKHSGLFPWSVEQALRNPRIHPSETVTIYTRKRKGIQMDGHVVTSLSFIESLKKHEIAQKKKQNSSKKSKV